MSNPRPYVDHVFTGPPEPRLLKVLKAIGLGAARVAVLLVMVVFWPVLVVGMWMFIRSMHSEGYL